MAVVFVASLFLLALAHFSMAHYDAEGNLRGIRIDFGFHGALITSLANGNFLPENPFWAGHALDYYYFLHLFSASLLLGGFDLLFATFLPRVLLAASIICLLVVLVSKLFPKKSFGFALLTLILVLFNGSFEFIPWMQQNDVSLETIHKALLDPAFFLGSRLNRGYAFQPLFPSILLLQPAFLIGIIVFLLVLLFLNDREEKKNAIFLGVVIGLLPMFHLFSFILVWAFIAAYYVLSRSDSAKNMSFVSLVIALPQLIYYLVVRNSLSSVSWFALRFGWMSASQDLVSIIVFWALNLGVYLVLGIAGYFLIRDARLKRCFLAVLPPAILANIFIFTPFAWDNFKFFVFFLILLAILSAYALDFPWRKSSIGKLVSIALFLIAIASAVLINWTFFVHTNDVIYPSNDVAACHWIDSNTPRNAIFLTNGGHTCLFSVSGRKVFVGPDFWLQSHGYNYSEELAESEQMFQHNCTLLKKNGINYLYTGGILGRSNQLVGWSKDERIYSNGSLEIYKPNC
jgi:hypothetical protein